jgi:predicted ester cyclase
MVVEGLVGEGDLVATRVIAFSTPRKPIVGSASGTWRMVPMIGTYRIADNQIAERWINADVLGTLAQLGEFPILRELE